MRRHLTSIILLLAVVVPVALTGCARRATPDQSSGPSSGPVATTPAATTPAAPGATAATSTVPEASASTTDPAGPTTTVPTAPPSAAGEVDASLMTPDGRNRSFHVVVPPSAAAATMTGSVPLLVALHGGTGWGLQYRQASHFDDVAQANGFIVVYPDGVGNGPNEDRSRTWNAGTCCGPAMNQHVDDVTFIRMLIDTLSKQHRIDPHRIYAAGHSNGAMLSYRLACELSDEIAAVGLQAGALLVDPCRPARPVSVIHLHGTADDNVPIGGGVGPHSISRTNYPVPKDGAATIATADGCGSPVDSSDPTNADVHVTTWSGCRAGTEVRFVAVTGATHAWMGGSAPAIAEVVGTPYAKLDASAEIWAFLAAHPRP